MAPTSSQPGRWVVSAFGGPSVLRWEPFETLPAPSSSQVRVRIITSGIGAVDNIERAGGYPDERTTSPGFTPGYEFVGVVDALGEGVTSVKVGDRVAACATVGGYGTHVVLPATDLLPLQHSDDPIKVAALPLNYMTAYGMVKRSGVDLKPGSTVLIGSAAGGLGTAFAQLNTALDLGLTIYGTCSPRNFDFVKALGIIPIDRRAPDLVARVKELTGGRGVDVAYDAAGDEQSLKTSLACTVDGTGEVRMIGVMSGILPGGEGMSDGFEKMFQYLPQESLPRTSLWILPVHYYGSQRELFGRDFEVVVQLVRDGKLTPMGGKLYRLDQAVEANELLANGAPFEGKMVFVVDEDLAKSRGL